MTSNQEVTKELMTLAGLVTAAVGSNDEELHRLVKTPIGRRVLTSPVGSIIKVGAGENNGADVLEGIIPEAGCQLLGVMIAGKEKINANEIPECKKKTDVGGLLNEIIKRLYCLLVTIGDLEHETEDSVFELVASWRLRASKRGRKRPEDDTYNLVRCLRALNGMPPEISRRAIEKMADTGWRSIDADWLKEKRKKKAREPDDELPF